MARRSLCIMIVLLVMTGRLHAYAAIADLTSTPINFSWEQDGISTLTSTPITFSWDQDGISNLTSTPITFSWEQDGISNLTSTPITFSWEQDGISNLTSTPITFSWEQDGISNLTSSPIAYSWQHVQLSQVAPDLVVSQAKPLSSLKTSTVPLNLPSRDEHNRVHQPIQKSVESQKLPDKQEKIQRTAHRLLPIRPTILRPAVKEQLHPDRAVYISVRVPSPGSDVVWEMEYKPFDRKSFAPVSHQISGMKGSANATLLSGRVKLADAGEYRIRFRVDQTDAQWSNWRLFMVGTPKLKSIQTLTRQTPTLQSSKIVPGRTKNRTQVQQETQPSANTLSQPKIKLQTQPETSRETNRVHLHSSGSTN